MKVATIIEARMSSTRLPGKVLKKIPGSDLTLIELMVNRARKSMLSDEVIVATTVNPNDDQLCDHLEKKGINFYRGSEENVLDRVLNTALKNNVDLIVEVTGDCPLLDHTVIDQSIGFFLKNKVDYVGNTCITNAYPRGMDAKVFTTKTLSKVNSLTQDPDDQEHVSLFIYNNRDIFKCLPLDPPSFFVNPKTRLTVDYPEDLQLVLSIIAELGTNCGFEQMCDLLNQREDLININGNIDVSYINDDTRNQ